MEGSLEMKEISYIHSEAYAAGERKHDTIIENYYSEHDIVYDRMADMRKIGMKKTGRMNNIF